jgi:hypothetical protein
MAAACKPFLANKLTIGNVNIWVELDHNLKIWYEIFLCEQLQIWRQCETLRLYQVNLT